MEAGNIFKSLKQKEFAKLYAGQTISLLGDAFTWIGLALMAYEFSGRNASTILSFTLTLRVTAFILFAPYAGVLADRFNRKQILLITDFSRALLVALLPFITAQWQIYVLMFLVNSFSAFFTPSFKASIPQMIRNKEDFAPAIALSNATYQLLGIMGPGIAGAIAAWLGAREIFFVDAFSFLASALFVLMIGRQFFQLHSSEEVEEEQVKWSQMLEGTRLLFSDRLIRFALFIELAVAIVGANILVNTVGQVKGFLHAGDKAYGWVMSALGIGASIAAFGFTVLDKTTSRRRSLILGGLLICFFVLPANNTSLPVLIFLWLIAGFGQNLAEMPSQVLIAERIPLAQQGRVYGAHFAWSHLWWAIGYPLAGFLGTHFNQKSFLIAGCIGLSVLVLVMITHLIFKSRVRIS